MRPHLLGSARRALWLPSAVAVVAAVATAACVARSGLPGATPARPPSKAAEREARAAWRGLPSSRSACPAGFDPFPRGGLASFYCHAETLLTLEQLERLAGMSSTRGPPAGAAPSAIARAFRQYDPRFVEWLRATLLVARADARFREETQPIYDRFVAPLARRWLATRRLMTDRRPWLDAEVRWVREAIERGTLPDHYYYARAYTHLGQAGAPRGAGPLTLAPWLREHVEANAVAFWIRRELDGSAPAFSAALEELVSLYDGAWLRAGEGMARAAPPPSPVPPAQPAERVAEVTPHHPGARLCGMIVEQLSAPPYAFLRLATDGGQEWVAVAARRFGPSERVCVGDLRSVEGFRSSALGRSFERVYFGAEPDAAPAASEGRGPVPGELVLAEGLGFRVTAAEFEARMAEQSPFARARYGTLERKREFLDNLVKFKVLVAEARRMGLDRDPAVVATLEKVMVQELVKRSVSRADGPPPTEAELRGAYERSRGELASPEKVRVDLFQLDAPPEPERRATAASAARLRERLAVGAPSKDPNAAADPWLDDAARKALDTGLLSSEELARRYGERLAEAAFALAKRGDVSQVVETPNLFFVARLTERQASTDRTFEQVRGQLAARLAREASTKEFDALVARLRAEARVRIDDAALERIDVR